EGKLLLIDREKGDFYCIEEEDTGRIREYMIQSAKRFQKLGYSLEEILVLSPMKKGSVGIKCLNARLREELNRHTEETKECKLNKRFFRQDDKVMQNVNVPEKDIYNGEIGIVDDIREVNGKDKLICIFDNERVIEYEKADLNQLELAFSITIHKSQGGEAPIVIAPITTSHYI